MGLEPLSAKQQLFAEKLFNDNYKILYARAKELLRCVDPSAAEDCLGNLFLTLCLCCEKVMRHKNPQAWLFLTLKYICLKHLRRVGIQTKHTLPLDNDSENITACADNWEDRLVNDILYCQWKNQNVMERLISELNQNEQEILRLKYKKGLSNKEIGDRLGKSEDAVRFTAYYVQKKLTEKIYSL